MTCFSPGTGTPRSARRRHRRWRATARTGPSARPSPQDACFWGVEAAFRRIHGVLQTAVGYTGGHVPDPTYERVCRGRAGHAGAVEVWSDPAQVSYAQLLQAFWRIHNPATRNRQRPDFGRQYRSAIFCHDAAQQEAAIASRDAGQQSVRRQIVTQITPASAFYRAGEYHQRYREKHGRTSRAVTIR